MKKTSKITLSMITLAQMVNVFADEISIDPKTGKRLIESNISSTWTSTLATIIAIVIALGFVVCLTYLIIKGINSNKGEINPIVRQQFVETARKVDVEEKKEDNE